jgi:Ser/Thr protein kinase RdoA (MazF antagonist)
VDAASDTWLRRFAERGYPAAKPLAAGMEGAVYQLDEELVAKVWTRREQADLEVIQAFYEELAAGELGFATPRFLEIWAAEGAPVTIEPRLPGVPLDEVRPLEHSLQEDAVACVLDVLDGLRKAGELTSARSLPALEEPRAMWEGARSWPAALGALLDRRLAASGDLLRTCVPGFERGAERLRALVAELEVEELTPIHGDLIPANVLVDEAIRPSSVLDFGFFTTVGDPLFDLAVTASVYDMYGPRAAVTEAAIDAAAARRWEVPSERLTLYRAAYAVATATIYDPEGEDGHFRWCVRMLCRDDVAELLGTDGGRARSER